MIRMFDLVLSGGIVRAAFEADLTQPPVAATSSSSRAGRPEVNPSGFEGEPPRPKSVEPGGRHERSGRFGGAELAAMLTLMGPQDEAGLLEGLLASHLLGCAVANAAQGAGSEAVVTLNHRVICKGTAPVDTNISFVSRVLRTSWNHRLKGWVAELEAEASAAGQLLMSSLTTLLVKPQAA